MHVAEVSHACWSGISTAHRCPEAADPAGQEALLPAIRGDCLISLQGSAVGAGEYLTCHPVTLSKPCSCAVYCILFAWMLNHLIHRDPDLPDIQINHANMPYPACFCPRQASDSGKRIMLPDGI